jgi:hypothetical protein
MVITIAPSPRLPQIGTAFTISLHCQQRSAGGNAFYTTPSGVEMFHFSGLRAVTVQQPKESEGL